MPTGRRSVEAEGQPSAVPDDGLLSQAAGVVAGSAQSVGSQLLETLSMELELTKAQVDSLRGEFEANERAQIVFAQPEAVRLLISQLCSLVDEAELEPASARRRQQFVFAAAC